MLRILPMASLVLVLLTAGAATAAEKPNIVILLADDLGWNDVSYHGSRIPTPHVDSIARDGIELDRFYSCPVCSPTRAGLVTGRYPIRYGLMRTVIPPWRDFGLSTEEVTLADALATAGYERRGVIGKWHLGHSRPKFLPNRRGFTDFYGHYNGAIDYFTHERDGEVDWHRNEEPLDEEGYATDLLGEAAVQFITSAPEGAPFFLYVPFNAVHTPLQATEEDLEATERNYANRGRHKLTAMAVSMDRAIGRILQALEDRGVAENTIVWFFSDNGGKNPQSSNAPLHGEKGEVYEGGVRVPAAVRWPAGLEGGQKSAQVTGYIDMFPTLVAVAGVGDHGGKPFDGMNIMPILQGDKPVQERTWFHFLAMGGPETEQIAVADGPWKLVVRGGQLLDPDQADQRTAELFHLERDPNEKKDVAADHPQVVERLTKQAREFRRLQPEDHLPGYREGSGNFDPPPHWRITEQTAERYYSSKEAK